VIDRPTTPPRPWADPFFTVGITGTNGKTSTTFLVGHAMRAAGHCTVVVGTLGYYIDDEVQDEPRTLQGFMNVFERAASRGARHAAVELTSLALARGYARNWRFDLGVFTNLSPDHLQTHGSWEHYLASKAQLLVHLGPGRTAVLNAGDQHSLYLDQAIPPDVERLWTWAPSRGPRLHDADLAAARVEVDPAGTRVTLEPSAWAERLGGELCVRLVGDVFAENALAAAAAAVTAGIPEEAVVRGLATCPPVRGRFEVLSHDPVVVVDYAHTPDALERTCDAARKIARGRVIVVFGAGGQRMVEKREPMGEAVGARADLAYVTNDNPRDEEPQAIAAAVVRGLERAGRAQVRLELDRRRAIEAAVAEAGPGDVVVVAGKGHETGQEIGDEVRPFSDIEEVLRITGGRTGG
jgi:UDP-N-acetylmuramoyl-L-alanyl-D-glutamate--2,6-diaminopimelate ligase